MFIMIKISARVNNRENHHDVVLVTNGREHVIEVPPKPNGFGSSANGGEMLFLALATCYCNDIYREAAKRNIIVRSIRVEVMGEFAPEPGSIAENITYKATVEAEAAEQEILALIQHTDTVAEIHNTLRQGTPVKLNQMVAKPV